MTRRSSKIGHRWAALEPLRRDVRHALRTFGKDVARELQVCCDWEPQCFADTWNCEVRWLGMTISPSYVGEPKCEGVIQRFVRTRKE